MNLIRKSGESRSSYPNILDELLNTGLSVFEDRRSVPALNVKEDENQLALELRVPGMKKADIHLDYKDGILTVSGEKNEEKEEKDKDKYLRREFCSYSLTGVSNYRRRDMMWQMLRQPIMTEYLRFLCQRRSRKIT